MALQILLNIFLACTWMFLKVSFHPVDYFVGYLLGLMIIFGFRRFFKSRFYLINLIAVLNLLFIFIKELVLSNFAVLKVILKPKLDMRPGIFSLETDLTSEWEITILANLITLTPGTLVVDISPDNRVLYIHAMDIEDVEESIASIKNTFEKAIKEVSR